MAGVAGQSAEAGKRHAASLAQRVASARDAAAKHPRIVVSDIEAALDTRYTVDTLAAPANGASRAVRFVWLMGSDNLVQIPRWRKWDAIFRREVPIAVAARPRDAAESAGLQTRLCASHTRAKLRGAEAGPPFAARLGLDLRALPSRQSATAIRARSSWPG